MNVDLVFLRLEPCSLVLAAMCGLRREGGSAPVPGVGRYSIDRIDTGKFEHIRTN